MQVDPDFPIRLQQALEIKGWNMSDLARQIPGRGSDGHIRPQSIQQWKAAKNGVARHNLQLAADALGVRLDWLVFGRGPMKSGEGLVLTAHFSPDWQEAIERGLTDEQRACLAVSHLDVCNAPYPFAYQSKRIVAEAATNLLEGYKGLVRLLVMQAMLKMSGSTRHLVLLMCASPFAAWPTLVFEAQLLGINAVLCETPGAVVETINRFDKRDD